MYFCHIIIHMLKKEITIIFILTGKKKRSQYHFTEHIIWSSHFVKMRQNSPVVAGESAARLHSLNANQFKINRFQLTLASMLHVQAVKTTLGVAIREIQVVVAAHVPGILSLWALPCHFPEIEDTLWNASSLIQLKKFFSFDGLHEAIALTSLSLRFKSPPNTTTESWAFISSNALRSCRTLSAPEVLVLSR